MTAQTQNPAITHQSFFDFDAVSPAPIPVKTPSPKRRKRSIPCTVLAEGTATFEEAVEAALPHLVDGDGDFLDLNFRFHGLKWWRVMRIDDLLGCRSFFKRPAFVGGDWVVPVGREIMHVYREGRRPIVDHRVATINVEGGKIERQRVVYRILLGD